MPLYEYLCQDCDRRFEVLQKMGKGAEALACPHCGGQGLAKQFSTFASAGSERGAGATAAARGPSCGTGGFT